MRPGARAPDGQGIPPTPRAHLRCRDSAPASGADRRASRSGHGGRAGLRQRAGDRGERKALVSSEGPRAAPGAEVICVPGVWVEIARASLIKTIVVILLSARQHVSSRAILFGFPF